MKLHIVSVNVVSFLILCAMGSVKTVGTSTLALLLAAGERDAVSKYRSFKDDFSASCDVSEVEGCMKAPIYDLVHSNAMPLADGIQKFHSAMLASKLCRGQKESPSRFAAKPNNLVRMDGALFMTLFMHDGGHRRLAEKRHCHGPAHPVSPTR